MDGELFNADVTTVASNERGYSCISEKYSMIVVAHNTISFITLNIR